MAAYDPIPGEGVYNWDMVMLFPFRTTGESNRRTFVNKMLGLRTEMLNGRNEQFVDEAKRFLHTDRCYMNLDGTPNEVLERCKRTIETAQHEAERNRARRERRDEMKRIIENEYVDFTGSDEPCRSDAFSRLFCSAIVRRLQQACGLTCQAKYSVDGDEVIVCVRADHGDLRTEADRQNYRLQTKNHPFACVDPKGGDGDAPMEVAFLPEFAKANPDALKAARARVKRYCDDSLDPELDPGLFRRSWQPDIQKYLGQFGHDPTFTDPHGVYFSPYIDVQENDTWALPLLRHYKDRKGHASEFRTVDRIRMITSIIARHLNVESMKHSKLVSDCFALHEQGELARLRRTWVFDWGRHPLLGGRDQPLCDIRNYFGEKIALYFAWVEHYTKRLRAPAAVGLIFFIISTLLEDGGTKYMLLLCFGLFVMMWGTLMTEGWKRHNAALNLWWGTADYHANEVPRPAFVGTLRYSPITDKPEMYHSDVKKFRRRVLVAVGTVSALVIGACFMTYFCLWLKNYLAAPEILGQTWGPIAGALANTGWIVGGNTVYRFIAVKLTNWENHRTETEWDRYMVTKTFLFRFFNSFASFFYVAFIKGVNENHCIRTNTGEPLNPSNPNIKQNFNGGGIVTTDCPGCGNRYKPVDCLSELQMQVVVVFFVQVIVGNIAECSTPFMKFHMRLWLDKFSHMRAQRNAGDDDGRRVAEKIVYEQPEYEAKLEPYLEWKYSFDDYSEMVLQYGYVILFVTAMPLSPLLALLNNIIEFHVDGYKLVCIHRRPWPYAAADIGQWAVFMDLLSQISVVTNLGVIIVTSGLFRAWPAEYKSREIWPLSTTTRFILFMAAEHVLLAIKWAISEIVPDVPKWVDQLSRRHEYTASKLKGLQNTHDDELSEEAEQVDVTIHDNSFRFSSHIDKDERRTSAFGVPSSKSKPKGSGNRATSSGSSKGNRTQFATGAQEGGLVSVPKVPKGKGPKMVV